MTRLVLLLCGALVVVIAAEIAPGHPPAEEFGPAGAARMAGGLARGISRPAEPALVRWVADILDRPLFAPDRRPAPGAPPTAVAAVGVPRLTGIVMTPDAAAAIFRQAANAKSLVVRPGDSVGGWVVSTIAANGVTLRKASERITVTPEFEAADAGAGVTAGRAAIHQGISRWIAAAPSGLLRARWSNPQLQP
jgi:hypothetical protein